jgi:hypothetical protein
MHDTPNNWLVSSPGSPTFGVGMIVPLSITAPALPDKTVDPNSSAATAKHPTKTLRIVNNPFTRGESRDTFLSCHYPLMFCHYKITFQSSR